MKRAGRLRAVLHEAIDLLVDAIEAQTVAYDEFCTSGPLPPGINRRRFNEWCASGKVNAQRDGRAWRCSRAAWFAARARTGKSTRVRAIDAPVSDEERAREMLHAAGFRRTRF